jgi:uncharacterized flavoprotein (TIGR03862 family)
MGFEVAWSETFRTRFAGQPLKRIGLTHGDRTVRGEAMLTQRGIEGGGIYALANQLRHRIERTGAAEISIDLRPDLEPSQIAERLANARAKESLANRLRKAAGLTPAAIGLMREASGAKLPVNPGALATAMKAVRLTLGAPFGLERAISTAGGIAREATDANLMLLRLPGVFVAGEMLDWEAPTGGYLLQACLSTGVAAARGAIDWLSPASS